MAADNWAFADVFNVVSVHGGLRKIRVWADAPTGIVQSLMQGVQPGTETIATTCQSIIRAVLGPPYIVGLTYQVRLISLS